MGTVVPHNSSMKSFICVSALVAVASVVHAAVAHPVEVYPDEVSPYTYNYAVADDYSGSRFTAVESDDGTGIRQGSYSVNLPDGRIQNVNYHTNDYDGYVADVTYDGAVAHPIAHPVAHHVAVATPVVAAVAHPVVSHGVVAGHGGLIGGRGLIGGHGLIGRHDLIGGHGVVG